MIRLSNNRKCFIYGLYSAADPDRIRYIGQTTKKVSRRLWEHVNYPKPFRNTHFYRWVDKNKALGHEIKAVTICIGKWNETEIDCIAAAKRSGWNLTNSTSGGGHSDHLIGKKLSEEHKAKLRGRPSYWKGKKFSQEHIRKIVEGKRNSIGGFVSGFKGKNHSEETRRLIAIKATRRIASAETKLKMSLSAKIGWEKRRASISK